MIAFERLIKVVVLVSLVVSLGIVGSNEIAARVDGFPTGVVGAILKAVGPAHLAAQDCEFCIRGYVTCGTVREGVDLFSENVEATCEGKPDSYEVFVHRFDLESGQCGGGGVSTLGEGGNPDCRTCGGTSDCHEGWDLGGCHPFSCGGGGGGAYAALVDQLDLALRAQDVTAVLAMLEQSPYLAFSADQGLIGVVSPCDGNVVVTAGLEPIFAQIVRERLASIGP
jgi:hypothetical protein